MLRWSPTFSPFSTFFSAGPKKACPFGEEARSTADPHISVPLVLEAPMRFNINSNTRIRYMHVGNRKHTCPFPRFSSRGACINNNLNLPVTDTSNDKERVLHLTSCQLYEAPLKHKQGSTTLLQSTEGHLQDTQRSWSDSALKTQLKHELEHDLHDILEVTSLKAYTLRLFNNHAPIKTGDQSTWHARSLQSRQPFPDPSLRLT